MFDNIFLCDPLNGHSFYDTDPEEEYPPERIKPTNPRYNDYPEKTYYVYGRTIKYTKKATLFKFIRVQDGHFVLDIEKWMPTSECLGRHISDYDRTSVSFSRDFSVTGFDDISKISIPGWLFIKMFSHLSGKQVYHEIK